MAYSLQRYMEPDVNSKLIQLFKDSKKERERSMEIEIANGSRNCLDEGVVVEILSWLPVKWLLQYKSVCKALHTLISSSNFVSKHLKNYYRNRNDSTMRDFFLKQSCVDYDLYHLQSLFLAVDEMPTPRVVAFEDMVNMPNYVSEICGPCDGLYYLFYYYDTIRALWNPAINELRVLPPLLTKHDPVSDPCQTAGEVYSLRFDYISSDYKVVVIKGYYNTVTNCRAPQSVIVYSLRNDCWRYCGDLRRYYKLETNKCYNLINGWYYWMESDYTYDYNKMSDAIIGFNLESDEFEEIDLPDYKKPALKSLGIYDDSLALLSFHLDDKLFEVWTFKVGIWVMKLRIGPFSKVWYPIGHWKDNKLFLESYDWLHLGFFDPESQDIKNLSYEGLKRCRGVFACGKVWFQSNVIILPLKLAILIQIWESMAYFAARPANLILNMESMTYFVPK
ncbi:hypothetical protein RND81_01G046800 [Saponaria officinalis]|uniref:F-box associated beta-propeller type 1 domain-containing protein n=1 Tax=Saponaria officinalis TaxID=3572 RepID=A0AAW1NCQ9_SAPOF